MIPYIHIPPIELGPLTIHAFGILAAAGVLFGSFMARKYADRYGLDEEDLRWIGIRAIVWGFIGSHIADVLFYTPDKLADDPLLFFKVWDGIASYGGFLGGAIAFVFYSRSRGLHPLRWADAITYGLVSGMILGRAACAVAHDHIGVTSDAPMAVDFSQGTTISLSEGIVANDGQWPQQPAHDLGFYEMLLFLGIFVVIHLLSRWEGRKPGTLLAATALLYAPPRFLFEFLRRPETDPVYLGLTFAQWAAILTFGFGVWLVARLVRAEKEPLHETPKQAPEAAAPAKGTAGKPKSKTSGSKKRR